MKKCELFPIFDKQKRQIKQVNSLASILHLADGINADSKDAINVCIGLVCDITDQLQDNHNCMAKALIELYVVKDAVNGVS